MALSTQQVTGFSEKSMKELLDYAVSIHKMRAFNIEHDIINLPLEVEAEDLHEYFYGHVSWMQFSAYVKHVHKTLKRPNWLAGRPGVTYVDYECSY